MGRASRRGKGTCSQDLKLNKKKERNEGIRKKLFLSTIDTVTVKFCWQHFCHNEHFQQRKTVAVLSTATRGTHSCILCAAVQSYRTELN